MMSAQFEDRQGEETQVFVPETQIIAKGSPGSIFQSSCKRAHPTIFKPHSEINNPAV